MDCTSLIIICGLWGRPEVIVDLRSVDPERPGPAGEYALQLTAALIRVAPEAEVTVLEPGFSGPLPAGGSLLLLAGGRPQPGYRCITAVHDVSRLRGGRGALRARFRTAFTLSRSDMVLTCSSSAADELKGYLRVHADRVHTVLPGLEPGFGRSSRAAAEDLRLALGLPKRYLIAFGDPALARRAFIGAKVPGDEAGLVDGNQLRPTRDQLAPLLSGAVGVLLCQAREGNPMLALQAMACGTPPVVPGDGAFPEVVRDGGLTIAAGQPGDWSEAISALYRSDQLRMQLSARSRDLAAEFSAERAARSLASLLQAGQHT